MPTFFAKKEVFQWLKQGRKTIDVRKGNPRKGHVAVFLCGPYWLRMNVVGVQSGNLCELIREDNFQQVIPSAAKLEDALVYLRMIYGSCDGIFTAYVVAL